jgi:hypothetical protein
MIVLKASPFLSTAAQSVTIVTLNSQNDFIANVPVHLLTPWSRVLLEKLTGSAVSQEIPHIFGTRRFLTVLTSARHLSLS